MLKKALAPMFLTSILVIAGCSSDQTSKDLEDAEDVTMEEEQQSNTDSEQENQGESKGETKEETEKDSNDEQANDSENNEGTDQNSESSDSAQNTDSNDNVSKNEDKENTEGSQGSGGSKGKSTDENNDQEGTNDSNPSSEEQQYTLKEVNGEAVNVLQGLNAVEIKRENISGATANTKVTLKVEGEQITLNYNEKRDSFRNYQIKKVELDKLKQATVIVNG